MADFSGVSSWLTGQLRTERTNASTTGLLDVTTGQWSPVLFDGLRLPAGLFPPVVEPGQTIGTPLDPDATWHSSRSARLSHGGHCSRYATASLRGHR
jgi:rhamnulokinase